MPLEYEKPWTGGTQRPCNCRPDEDQYGLRHDTKCPKWIAEWRRRSVPKDLTNSRA